MRKIGRVRGDTDLDLDDCGGHGESEAAVAGDRPKLWVRSFDEAATERFIAELFAEAEKRPGEDLVVLINSYGGDMAGLAAMYSAFDAVREGPTGNHIITACMSQAQSCGAMLLSYGDQRYATKYSTILLHEPGWTGLAFSDVASLRRKSKEMLEHAERWYHIIADNCGLSYDAFMDWLKAHNDHEITADQALALGLIDKIGVPGEAILRRAA